MNIIDYLPAFVKRFQIVIIIGVTTVKINKLHIREQNEALVLKGIIDHKNISRAELSSLTGLNKASVSSITKTLLEDNLISETGIGPASNQGGRKPIMLQFNPQAATIVSIDLGVDYIKGILTYLDGAEIQYIERKRLTVNANSVLAIVEEMIDSLKKDHTNKFNKIIGMSIGIHGVVQENQINFTPYYDLDTIDLYQELKKNHDFPIFIENEANLAALGEYTFSDYAENIVSLSIHSGIGAGIVKSGILQKGKHGEAGEIGHSILFPSGEICPCGNKGCLERYASSSVLYNLVSNIKNIPFVDSSVIAEVSQDIDVNKLLQKNAYFLSIGINNIATIYDPEIVIINSSVYQKLPYLLQEVQMHLESQFSKNIVVQTSSLADKATLYGGISLCCQTFLNIQQLKMNA